MKNDIMNIFEMYLENGNRVGFWVQRNSWSKNIARITLVGVQTDGPLEGDPPYYRNPKVRADVFDGVTARMIWVSGKSGKNQEISCPGTGAYTRVATPSWWSDSN